MDGSKGETGDCQPSSLSNCLITSADAIAPFCSSKDLHWFKYCGRKYDDDAQIRMFVDEAIRTVGGLPGVKSAAIGSLFLGRLPNSQLQVEGRAGATSVIDDEPTTWIYVTETSSRQWEFLSLARKAFHFR